MNAGCGRRVSLGLPSSSGSFNRPSSSRSSNRRALPLPLLLLLHHYEPDVLAIPLPVTYSCRSYISRSSAMRYLLSLQLSSHLFLFAYDSEMTSSGAPVANAAARNAAVSNLAGAYSTFNTLRLGRSAQTFVARLIRFWDSRNIHKNGEFMGITILLLDEQTLLVKYVPFRGLISKMTQLLPELTVTVNVSLWDEAASAFRGLLRDGDKSQSVMLVTSVNPKMFGGNLYLNSTQGTRFFFDTTLPEIAEFVSRVGATSAQVYSCVNTLEGIKKKELVSIRDLNSFISSSNEQTQEADFLCKARIVCVIPENGWSFVSCTICHKKLERLGTSLNCTRCVTSDVTGVVRFRVELAVDDGNDSATFVVFDKEMTKLTKQEASVLALDAVSNGGEEYLPSCLEELAGKEFVFQIRVITPFNFTPNHHSTIATQLKEHSEGIIPSGTGDVGLTAPSSGPSVLEVKHGEECASAAPPENADTLKKRKPAPVPTTAVDTAADANAAVAYSTFNSLRLGRSAQSVVGRLIRFWDTQNVNKNGDFMGITILLLDEQNNAATSRIVVRLLIETTVTVNVYLWDESASIFRGLLKAGDKSQSLVLLTSVNPKLFGGELYLNPTQGTRFFFDTAVPEIAEFVARRNDLLSIWELDNLASQIKEHSEVILPNESGDVGLTASSSSPSDLGAKNGEICASAIPHENADALK
ncbi:hypothetical protein HID58_079137 [Brassica napus]|uniref:Replication factor A C-terminal domain-containing protein n=1 Tax=Brassica napus TaxID=3708 RepID=A0ABQ7Y3X1_BRANA|nr:hypothetical protein HID58_079137 [Brassica napus]